MEQVLHFTIGPVQSFVGQARRTRDLWAGSFLLSWLAGQAMFEVLEKIPGSEITFPVARENGRWADPVLRAIAASRQGKENREAPIIGSLPNRFRATVPPGTENKEIQAVAARVREKWQSLAKAVKEEFLPESVLARGENTGAIWDSQIADFWEITWVMGKVEPDSHGVPLDGSWLELRKNWRNQRQSAQGGDHCTLMGDWQEISGHIRSHHRENQDRFWEAVQSHPKLGRLELREGERLCAVSLVKRLFPRLDKQDLEKTIGWIPGGELSAVGNWPSTAYLAAIPWLTFVNDTDTAGAFERYAETAKEEIGEKNFRRLLSEQATRISRLDRLHGARIPVDRIPRSLSSLDGNLFFEDAVINPNATPFEESPGMEDREKHRRVQKALRELNGLLKAKATPFYALLLLDGDRLGRHLRDKARENRAISQALANFSGSVAAIVEAHQGVTIYAGGDDVLALLPVTTATDCAVALHGCYLAAFRDLFGRGHPFTASAAIVFAHYHLPLKSVLGQAHIQLERFAKEENGRASLAFAVCKSEGVTARWTGSFTRGVPAYLALKRKMFQGAYSTGFLYNLGKRCAVVETHDAPPVDLHTKDLIRAEFSRNRIIRTDDDRRRIDETIDILYAACRFHFNDGRQERPADRLQLDAPYIARFAMENGDPRTAARRENERD